MKLHNSTQMSHSSYHERQFIIRYQETNRIAPKKKTNRYSVLQENQKKRLYISSETDVYKNQKTTKTQRKSEQPSGQQGHSYHKKKVKLVTPTLGFGSMTDIIEQTDINTKATPKKNEIKEMPRIPIDYNDQKVNGLLADTQRLKVVYRGYAPKNTFFFFKALSSKNNMTIDVKSKMRSDFQLQFDSKFQSGNLSAAARKSSKQFWLYLREDTNTNGLRQWYNFSIFNRKIGTYKFRLYKFSKFYSLYKEGMKPFIKDDFEQNQWRQGGKNIKYQYDAQSKCHYLEFQYQFKQNYMSTEFATQPPYTYSMLRDYLQLASQKYPDLAIKKAGTSLAGLQIPKIEIKDKKVQTLCKQAVIIISRTHPSETASNYALEGFIQKIFELQNVRKSFDFYIIPMVNPDGVFLGNHRTGVLGQDINRNFNSLDVQFFPEIGNVIKLIEKVKSQQKIAFLFDLHGHSAKRNIFAYGDESIIGSTAYLKARIIPKILSEAISTFKYNYCVFKSSKQKKNTARVFLSKKFKINALTFEQSYGLIDEGPIGITHWKNFGISLAQSLEQYIVTYEKGNLDEIEKYLQPVILEEKLKNQKKLLKKMQAAKEKQQFKDEEISPQKNQMKKFKTENLFERDSDKEQPEIPRKLRKSSLSSIDSEQLSSGDQDLENDGVGFQVLKKQLIRIGCLKEGAKREIYNIAEKKIQIRGNYEPRLHQQKSSMIPRILKYQMRKKEQQRQYDLAYNNFSKASEQKSKNKSRKLRIFDKTQRDSIELPYLRK